MLHVSCIRYKQRKHSSTRSGAGVDGGHLTCKRTEWGIGKGQWKRAVKKAARELGMEGQTRATYFLVGSRYTVEYRGSKAATDQLYESL